jgi:lactam utilization protein B
VHTRYEEAVTKLINAGGLAEGQHAAEVSDLKQQLEVAKQVGGLPII